MEAAAYKLPVPPQGHGAPVTLYFLTGKNYWYQTAFCLWSFAAASKRPLSPTLFDDGSLEKIYIEPIQRIFPSLHVVSAAESLARLDEYLPQNRYPSLRARRLAYPHLKKLLDLHVGQTGYRLQMDSDLLFFKRPDCLLNWYDNPQCPLRAEDIANAYGYPLNMLAELSGYSSVPERVNAGLLGLRSEDFDWDKMEYWCRELLARQGPSYYQEQALLAMLLAGRACIVPDEKQYLIRPEPPEALRCEAVMHHYVAESRRWYYQHNWRRFGVPQNNRKLINSTVS
ncbi:hypothetical protein [Cephaloticoccus primus]|nr:hypothetical protein [Cephaloticoccus primus]